MKATLWIKLIGLLIPVVLLGCKDATGDKKTTDTDQHVAPDRPGEDADKEAEIRASLALLGPDDRKSAEEQRFCAVQEKNRLGSMGAPFKTMVQGQPVFLCCKGCEKKAQKNADGTLAKVKELRDRAANTPPK